MRVRAKVLHRLKCGLSEMKIFYVFSGVVSLIGIVMAALPSPLSVTDRIFLALGASGFLIVFLLADLTSASSEEREQKRREMEERELAEMKKRQE